LLWFFMARTYYDMHNDYDEDVMQTILQSAVNVLLIGMYTTVVRTCLQVADCTSVGGVRSLILDPTYQCSDILVYQLIGGGVFLLWGCLPYLILGYNLIKYRRRGRGVLEEHMAESMEFRVKYGWAVKKYKQNSKFAFLWEVQNAMTKVFMVIGSELMYGPKGDEFTSNRTVLHLTTLATSFVMHVLVRPYNDKMANVVVVLFGATSLVGVFASTDPMIQKIFVAVTILSILFVVGLLLMSLRSYLKAQKKLAKLDDTHSTFKKHEFSLFETKLLFPFLLFVWIMDYLMKGLHKCFDLCSRKKK